MKSRSKEFLNRSVDAMVAAVEIYNKPNFGYREESFAVLAINAWELLLKAKWLADNNNKLSCLIVFERITKKDGTRGRKLRVKKTRSGNPFTHGLDFIAKKMVDQATLAENAWKNLQALVEMRDSSIHFYNRSGAFPVRLQEIGMACVKNFVAAASEWFDRGFGEFNFYLMPLSFINTSSATQAIVLNQEEKNFIEFVEDLESDSDDPDSDYSVTVNVDVRFTRSIAKGALEVRLTNDPSATPVRLTDEQIREKYPWSYDELSGKCSARYANFKINNACHQIRKPLERNDTFAKVRFLDPGNPRSSKKTFYNPNILSEFDKHYTKK